MTATFVISQAQIDQLAATAAYLARLLGLEDESHETVAPAEEELPHWGPPVLWASTNSERPWCTC